MNDSEYSAEDIEIDKALSRMEIHPDSLSPVARERIRNEVRAMIEDDLDFSDQDQINELERTINLWIGMHPD